MAAAEEASPVTSVRSFRGMNEGRSQLFAESSSVAVDEGTDWGGVETLDVPQTKSQAEKDAEAAQQRAEEEARRQAAQQAAAAASSTVSRSQVRTGTDSGLASYTNIDYSIAPAGFNPNHEIGDVGNRYAANNCTWWAYERRHQLGLPVGSFFGNGAQWAASAAAMGYWVDNTPRMIGDIMVFQGGQAGSSWGYGHVAIVEEIYPTAACAFRRWAPDSPATSPAPAYSPIRPITSTSTSDRCRRIRRTDGYAGVIPWNRAGFRMPGPVRWNVHGVG